MNQRTLAVSAVSLRIFILFPIHYCSHGFNNDDPGDEQTAELGW